MWVGGTRKASRRELTRMERTLVGWSEGEGKGTLPVPAMGLKVASKCCELVTLCVQAKGVCRCLRPSLSLHVRWTRLILKK